MIFQWIKKFIPKRESSMGKCYRYAVLALAYRRLAIREGDKEEGFKIVCEGTANYVEVK